MHLRVQSKIISNALRYVSSGLRFSTNSDRKKLNKIRTTPRLQSNNDKKEEKINRVKCVLSVEAIALGVDFLVATGGTQKFGRLLKCWESVLKTNSYSI